MHVAPTYLHVGRVVRARRGSPPHSRAIRVATAFLPSAGLIELGRGDGLGARFATVREVI